MKRNVWDRIIFSSHHNRFNVVVFQREKAVRHNEHSCSREKIFLNFTPSCGWKNLQSRADETNFRKSRKEKNGGKTLFDEVEVYRGKSVSRNFLTCPVHIRQFLKYHTILIRLSTHTHRSIRVSYENRRKVWQKIGEKKCSRKKNEGINPNRKVVKKSAGGGRAEQGAVFDRNTRRNTERERESNFNLNDFPISKAE